MSMSVTLIVKPNESLKELELFKRAPILEQFPIYCEECRTFTTINQHRNIEANIVMNFHKGIHVENTSIQLEAICKDCSTRIIVDYDCNVVIDISKGE